MLYHWKDYKSIRSKIEDFFKFRKMMQYIVKYQFIHTKQQLKTLF